MNTQNYKMKFSFSFFVICLFYLNQTLLADGLIVIRKPFPGGHPFPLEVVYHNVDVLINGQIATTSIDQAFFNPTYQILEGYYLFPIPKGAVIKNFSMMIDGKQVEAELLDADKARKIYEDIVRRMKDPALLEYGEQGLFKVRIFPIEPRSEKKVSISYTEVISNDSGMYEYIYPLNTEKFSAKPLKNVSVNVNVKMNDGIKTIYSPTHQVDVVRRGKSNAVVSYEEQNVKPDIDFKLYFNTGNSELGLSLLSYKERNEDGYFFLSLSPPIDFANSEILAKDITFVLDVSGSMAGEKLKHAKAALNYCVDNLNKRDRFEIVKFSTEAYALFHGLVDADEDNRDKALEFIKRLKPIGGTNIEEAIQLAIKNKDQNNRPHMIIFLTDGKPTIGETEEDKLVENIKKYNAANTRIFTFGIGDEINTHLLDKITELTNATRTYVSPSEDIEIKISQFYDKVQSPVITNLELDFGDVEVYQTYPKNLPDLFKGSNLILFGRYKGSGKNRIVLRGEVNGGNSKYSFSGNFTFSDLKNDFIPPLWASRRIGHLLDLVRLHGESKEMIDEITDLARTHGIITPYTSYLILEDEEIRVQRRELAESIQTMRGTGAASPSVDSKLEEEFYSLDLKSGEEGVRVSKELQDLNSAHNLAQTQQGKKRMNFVDKDNNEFNLLQRTQFVQGRAFYQNGDFWVDSRLQNIKSPKNIRIQFGSDEYFRFAEENIEAGQFLALGQNIRFAMDGNFYEIYE